MDRMVGASPYFFNCIHLFVQFCREHYLNDFCDEYILVGRFFENEHSMEEELGLKEINANHQKYLENAMEMNLYLRRYKQARDIFAMIVRKLDAKKNMKLDLMETIALKFDRSNETDVKCTVYRLVEALNNYDSNHVANSKPIQKDSSDNSHLINQGKGMQAENEAKDSNKELITLHNNLLSYATNPTRELNNQIVSCRQGQNYGVTSLVLDKVFMAKTHAQFLKLRQVYLNCDPR